MEKREVGAHAIKRVAARAHLPTPWLFEPAKRPDDRADYCLGLPQTTDRMKVVLIFICEKELFEGNRAVKLTLPMRFSVALI